jgi:ribonucleoside-diphosphate reductase beta chain
MNGEIFAPTESILVKYQKPVDFANKQLEVFWTADEINVENDIHSIRVDMDEAERHGVLTTLRLFTLYELRAGSDYWRDVFPNIFPRPEFGRMASVFSMFELAIHAPFYDKLNQALNVSTDDFYLSYVKDPALKQRMDFITAALDSGDPLYSVGVFSLIEGAVLYSSFAFLKHFQANGKNKLSNVCRGIDFSVRDEALHAEGGAYAFREGLKQSKSPRALVDKLYGDILDASSEIRAHEYAIIDKIFEKGDIPGISKDSLRQFVNHRISTVLVSLGITKEIEDAGPVGEWFYKDINDYKFNDFFAGQGREYTRNWDEKGFTF